MQSIELLSPAKNLECGIAAVNHGADAVYIGASRFGARAVAGNSIKEIETLVKYAHKFRSRIYVTLNTLLTDEELPAAEKLIWEIYESGADALIIQDMGILKMHLPPIALHASTQTDNRDIDKIKFLADQGISRVVLARELSVSQIKNIHSQTDVELEAFVHGALCVSYSGQCYISRAMCGRSANRGECAQFCRLPYDLLDTVGNVLQSNKHLLSLKDLNQSDHLSEMMDAGIRSFKIEGRLKDLSYVKNITAYYRKKIDFILAEKKSYQKSSLGKTSFFFEPNVSKSFNRGFTNYFLHKRTKEMIQADTPKSLGEKAGKVKQIGDRFFELSGDIAIHNGDGLCFVNKNGVLNGFRVNKVENNKIYPLQMPDLEIGTVVYRNFDSLFEKQLEGKTAERKVPIFIRFDENSEGFVLHLSDEEGISMDYEIKAEKQLADHPEKARETIRTQFAKLGNTIYKAEDIRINCAENYFFPTSLLSEWRRQAIEMLDKKRDENYLRPTKKASAGLAQFPVDSLSYQGNVTNSLAEKFYREHGVKHIQPGFEMKAEKNVALMFTKYCIKYELDRCPKEHDVNTSKETLYLRNGGKTYELSFDCKLCEMRIKYKNDDE